MKMFLGSGSRVFFPALVAAAMAILLLVWPAVDRGSSCGWFLSGSAHVSNTEEWRKGGKDDDESITLRDVAFG